MKKTLMQTLMRTIMGIALIALVACTPQAPTGDAPEQAPMDYAALVADAQDQGANVAQAGEVEQPFFAIKGTIAELNGASVQVFEFSSEQEAKEAASTISPDGSSVGTSMIMWVDTPHFYQKGRLIALYIGQDGSTLALLRQLLGEPLNNPVKPATPGLETVIQTRAGDLTLSHAAGKTLLRGALRRSTPCVNWQIDTVVMESFPEQVRFSIEDRSTAEVCIQMLGEPQDVYAEAMVSPEARITVLFEGEPVFEGQLG